jgi:hypothetical protein
MIFNVKSFYNAILNKMVILVIIYKCYYNTRMKYVAL